MLIDNKTLAPGKSPRQLALNTFIENGDLADQSSYSQSINLRSNLKISSYLVGPNPDQVIMLRLIGHTENSIRNWEDNLFQSIKLNLTQASDLYNLFLNQKFSLHRVSYIADLDHAYKYLNDLNYILKP